MKAFIKGIGSISPQAGFGNKPFESVSYKGGILTSIELDYSAWIEPNVSRRMSKIIRMGVASAMLSLQDAGIKNPDAIIAGTGLGCLKDTTTFLTKLIQNKEEALNPTPFIQSTHNTIASQIALLLKCHGHNQTFTQRALSFEYALQDALMLLSEKPNDTVLVGAADEVTELTIEFADNLNVLSRCEDSLKLMEEENLGTIHGEGAAFFVLNNSKEDACAEIIGLDFIYKPANVLDIEKKIEEILKESSVGEKEIDLVLLGNCGDGDYDRLMNEVSESSLKDIPKAIFKNLCGEYSTASSFALWLSCMTLKSGFLPEEVFLGDLRPTTPPKTILIYNQYFNQHHSLILVKSC